MRILVARHPRALIHVPRPSLLMFRRFFLPLALPLLLLTVTEGSAQGRPDLSGTWTIDSARTQWGMMPPAPRTDRIVHTATELTVARQLTGPDGSSSVVLTYGFDDAEYRNTFGPIRLRSRLRWDGAVLVITSDQETPQGALRSVDRYALSTDGRTLTVDRAITFDGGEDTLKLVFVKQ